MHATSAASERNWSVWGQIYTKYRNKLSLDNKSSISEEPQTSWPESRVMKSTPLLLPSRFLCET
eukprot:365725-Chlamydomonas_euryale.AAC.4